MRQETNIEDIASRSDVLDHIGTLLSGDGYADRCFWINDNDTAKAFLGLLVHVIKSNTLILRGMQDSKSRARRFLMKLGSLTKTLPDSLFLRDGDVEVPQSYSVGYGAYSDVYKGFRRGGRQLRFAVKRIRERDKKFYFEVLAWSTLSHRYLLPFVGIYRANVENELFIGLVSPFMGNGTLSEWRKKQGRSVPDILRRISEVAEGLCYLHCEKVVHGDIRGNNVLLDENFQAKIADFGLTRHFDVTGTATFNGSMHFMAPEMFSDEDENELFRGTEQTDVYSFACLFYETYFGEIPFKNKRTLTLPNMVKKGKRPERLQDPHMDDDAWDLVTRGWRQDPHKRPNMEEIIQWMESWR